MGKKIDLPLIRNIYIIAKAVYDNHKQPTIAIRELVNKYKMNVRSANYYVYGFNKLMKAEKYTGAMSALATDYFLQQILKDYSKLDLANALSSLYKHIEYYEGVSRSNSLALREVHKRYSNNIYFPRLIVSREELIENIKTIENYLIGTNGEERLEALNLIKRGTCFVAYEVGKELRFASSRFIGYKNNKLELHENPNKDGKETNKAIKSILNSNPIPNELLDEKYSKYCQNLGIEPQTKGAWGVKRKFWRLKLSDDFNNNDISDGFPEGRIVEKMHKTRERDPKVIAIAKREFKKKHGKLFCQVCKLDFEERYGSTGKDFIEGHHTIAVEDMPPDYKTKPEEIAMLCSNCHRMVHRKRPWLSMEKLAELLIK